MFNVRVYGILIENKSLLVSDEMHAGMKITKFPGGGLQFGEGTHECLQREFIEELELQITIKKHFYTVDFFQPSAFDSSQQVISIYYLIEKTEPSNINVSEKKFDFTDKNSSQSFRWVPLNKLFPDEFTFPIDQKVSQLLKEYFKEHN